MDALLLSQNISFGSLYEATICPQAGMNFLSLKWRGIELLDQTTYSFFEERMAGLGALIGPHFHSRSDKEIPPFDDEALFPHIRLMKAQGRKDFFSHGIGRYAPWRILSATSSSVQAVLRGSDRVGHMELRAIEGYDFEMHFRASLSEEGIEIFLKYQADHPSTMGLHYYFALPQGKSYVEGRVQDVYNDGGKFIPLPQEWKKRGELFLPLDRKFDYGFLSEPHLNQGEVRYHNELFTLDLSYQSPNACSWQLFKPEESSFVCIEPICARNPRFLTQTEGEIVIKMKASNSL
jgi:hypothetical protein